MSRSPRRSSRARRLAATRSAGADRLEDRVSRARPRVALGSCKGARRPAARTARRRANRRRSPCSSGSPRSAPATRTRASARGPTTCVSARLAVARRRRAAWRCRSRAAATWPSAVTRMFDGLRSRCTTSRPCAYATARATCEEQAQRARARRAALRVAVRVDAAGRRRTPARDTAGRRRRRRRRRAARCSGARAMARMSRSRAMRSARSAPPGQCGSFSATWRCSAPSARSASHTAPMPPSPMRRSSR